MAITTVNETSRELLTLLLKGIWFYIGNYVMTGALLGALFFCLKLMSLFVEIEIHIKSPKEVYEATWVRSKPASEAFTPIRTVQAEVIEETAPYIGMINLSKEQLKEVAKFYARKHGIDEDIFLRLIHRESSWKITVVSNKGATGLAQLMPGTAEESCGLVKADLINPHHNLDCGAKYLAEQLDTFGDIKLAVAAYNAGPDAVKRYGNSVPPYKETQKYVAYILQQEV